jgi:hypothetical protein
MIVMLRAYGHPMSPSLPSTLESLVGSQVPYSTKGNGKKKGEGQSSKRISISNLFLVGMARLAYSYHHRRPWDGNGFLLSQLILVSHQLDNDVLVVHLRGGGDHEKRSERMRLRQEEDDSPLTPSDSAKYLSIISRKVSFKPNFTLGSRTTTQPYSRKAWAIFWHSFWKFSGWFSRWKMRFKSIIGKFNGSIEEAEDGACFEEGEVIEEFWIFGTGVEGRIYFL